MTAAAEAHVRIEARDFVFGSLFATWRAFRWIAAIWIGIIVFQLVLVLFVDREGSPTPASLIPMVAIVTAFVALAAGSALLTYRRLPVDRRTFTWRFFPSHIDSDAPLCSGRLEWALFTEVRETRQHFLFFVNRAICHIVPKRCFGDPSEITRVRELCREHLKDKARVGSVGALR